MPWKSVKKCIVYSQLLDLRFFFAKEQNFSKIHKTYKKKSRSKQKNMFLLILNDQLNFQVSSIFMNSRSIHVETLRE
jgi:hypothetical protein